MSDFFRPEVARHRQREAIGSIRLVRPLTLSLLTASVVAMAIAVATWLYLASYTREVHLHGVIRTAGEGGLRATLFATAANARALRAGLAVRFRFPALSSGALAAEAGTLVSISRLPVRVDDLRELPAAWAAQGTAGPLYRVDARSDAPVPPGDATASAPVEVDAAVSVGRRRLIEWLFDPRARAGAPG